MASPSAMFEVVSGSGSTSSDSIVNISRSGASSIVTPATTTTTNPNEDELKTEVDQLRKDKKVLEGRIRGFKTLSDLLVDFRKENDQLRCQLKALNAEPLIMPGSDFKAASVSSPFSLVSLQAAQQNQSSSTMSQFDMSQLTLQDQKPSSTSSVARSTSSLDPKGPPVSYPPVSGPPFSLQETVGPPGDLKETKLISLLSPTESGTKLKLNTAEPQGSVSKQESLEPTSGQHPDIGTTQTSKTHHDSSMASENSSPELLQLDSDKYDEATYEKVGLQLGMGLAGLTNSMYAVGGSTRESRPTDFPSLSSGISNSFVQPSSHDSTSNPPFMGMMHQSLTGLQQNLTGMQQSLTGSATNKHNSDLATEVENITERLNSEPGDSMPAIAFQMHQIAERISKLEQKERNQKTLNDTLMRKNQELKRLVKVTETTHQTEIVALREQNMRLIQQLKGQHHEDQTKSKAVKSSGSHSDWVHVEKPPQMGESLGNTDHSLVGRVRSLEQEKAELLRANSNWKSQWDQMELDHQTQINELRPKLVLLNQELVSLKTRLAEQTSEFEGRMLEMKRRTGEEENLKEEAQHQQRLAERRCSELQDQLNEMRTQVADLARDKHVLSTELNILKAHTTNQEMRTGSAIGAADAGSRSALEAEIAMLKEQLKVFAEDFEQERIDRTTAQAARDSAKKSVDTMARQLHSLSSQVKHLQKQIKDRDDTISWTLRQNETLQRQATDFKKKLASEWEEKQSLQRRVLALEQQLQQQPIRNPYLTSGTTYNPAPMHQPSPLTRTTAPYFGGQGPAGGPGRNRPITTAMSPEHLPGAWTCTACTYINYPGRTVCESCGLVNTARSHPDQFGFASHDMYGSEHALLMSRGGDHHPGGGIMPTNGDLVVDSGVCATTPY